MIELYDAERLTIKRDHSLAAASFTLLFTASVMAAYTGFLHLQLRQAETSTQELQTQLAALATPAGLNKAAAPSPRATLVAELRRQAEQLERDAAINSAYGGGGGAGGTGSGEALLSPAQWMHSLAALAQADTSLQKVDVDRSGSARIEGLASHPQALNNLVQAWEKHESLALVLPRGLEIRQEKGAAPLLRFQLRAAPSAADNSAALESPTSALAKPAAPATAAPPTPAAADKTAP